MKTSDFWMMYGLKSKPVRFCPLCHTEHYGKCHFLRSKKHRKAKSEEVEKWNEAQRQRKAIFHAQKLIKELCDGIDIGRFTARPSSRVGGRPKGTKNRLAMGANWLPPKKSKTTRNRTSED